MSIQEQLADTIWSLKIYQSEDKNGEIIYPLGQDATGFIMFSSNHYMSVHIMKAGRDEEVSSEKLKLFNTEAEKQMAKLGYHAYSGNFSLDEEKTELTTHVKVSLLPSYVGSNQTRSVKIEGDKLYLSNVVHPERKLVWKKIEG